MMDLVKKYVLRLPQGIVTVEKDELVAKVKEILKDHPSEHMNAYRVWYEGFEGCGMPGTDVYDVIVETMRSMTDDWKIIGPQRMEKYGVIDPTFLNLHYATAQKRADAPAAGGNAAASVPCRQALSGPRRTGVLDPRH